MYITVKDIQGSKTKQEQIRKATNNMTVVDKLFAGVLDENEDVTPILDIPDVTLLRTKTYEMDTANRTYDKVSREEMLIFKRAINDLWNKHKDTIEDEYVTFKIPKRTHGFRTINAPKDELKEDQRRAASIITDYLTVLPHDSAWAYIKNRDVVGAMKEHVSNKSRWYLKIDLHDFFGSCNTQFVTSQLLKVYPFCYYEEPSIQEAVNNLVKLGILNGSLPQGTPLSPILTNLVMVEYDYKINKMLYALTKDTPLMKQRYVYTRYADDIIISARNKFDYRIILKALNKLFKDTPLSINKEKTRFGSNSGRNWNLGVMCNKENNITVGYRRKQEIKAATHNYMTAPDDWKRKDLQWLLGQYSWIHNVEPEYYSHLIEYFNKKYNCDIVKKIITQIKTLIN